MILFAYCGETGKVVWGPGRTAVLGVWKKNGPSGDEPMSARQAVYLLHWILSFSPYCYLFDASFHCESSSILKKYSFTYLGGKSKEINIYAWKLLTECLQRKKMPVSKIQKFWVHLKMTQNSPRIENVKFFKYLYLQKNILTKVVVKRLLIENLMKIWLINAIFL